MGSSPGVPGTALMPQRAVGACPGGAGRRAVADWDLNAGGLSSYLIRGVSWSSITLTMLRLTETAVTGPPLEAKTARGEHRTIQSEKHCAAIVI